LKVPGVGFQGNLQSLRKIFDFYGLTKPAAKSGIYLRYPPVKF
jgi:hypothetical protein